MAVVTVPWNPSDHFETYEDVVEIISIALEDYGPVLMEHIVDDISHSKAMSELLEKWAMSADEAIAYIREQIAKTPDSDAIRQAWVDARANAKAAVLAD